MSIDAQTVQQGISQAEAWGTMLGALGVWKGLEFGAGWWQRRRQAQRDAEAQLQAAEVQREAANVARVKAAGDAARAEVEKEQKLQARRDAVDEWQRIADERRDEAHNCNERLAVVEDEMEKCKEDRAALRSKYDAIEKRVTNVENGHGSSK